MRQMKYMFNINVNIFKVAMMLLDDKIIDNIFKIE